jgi:ABC-type Fe3+ transport system substrate-binding protein
MKNIFCAFFFLITAASLPCKERLVIISPHWEGVRIEISEAFNKWHMDKYGGEAEIEWIDQGGTSDNMKFVESLYSKTPEGIGIDMFFGGGISPYISLKEKSLLEQYRMPKELLKQIPAFCAGIPNYDRDFYWYGIILSGFGILYNKKVLDFLSLPEPETWESLGDRIYFGWVGNGDPRHSGSLHMMYEIILQAYGWKKGWEVIFAIAGNTRNFSASASAVAKNTSSGEVAVSLCIDSYALAQIEVNGAENMGFLLPEKLTVINPDAIGILKGAPNLATAKRFIDFLLSYEGQLIWIQKKGKQGGPRRYSLNRFSIRPDVYKDNTLEAGIFNPYSLQGTVRYDFDLASKRWDVLNDLVGALIIDPHRHLRKSWGIIVRSDKNASLRSRFFGMPVDAGLQRFLWENWDDPVFRNQNINQWVDFSRGKFKSIERQSKLYK